MVIWGSLLISQIPVSHPEAADSDSPGEETGGTICLRNQVESYDQGKREISEGK